jgi:hypothetical protein
MRDRMDLSVVGFFTGRGGRFHMLTRKIERAKKHRDELLEVVRRFWDTKPIEIASKIDPMTSRRIYYLS